MDLISSLSVKCRLRTASSQDSVLNSECAYTFHSPYTSKKGIVVNLSSFIGTVDEFAFASCSNEDSKIVEKEGLFLRIVKKRLEKEIKEDKTCNDDKEEAESDLSNKVTKLGVGVEGGFLSEGESFETKISYSIVALSQAKDNDVVCGADIPFDDDFVEKFPAQVSLSAKSIINHGGLALQQDLKAWELDEEPKPVTKYADALEFVDNDITISPNFSDWQCQKSGDKENIWLNLSDGFIGGGRKNWDGSGGSNGAVEHFEETGEKFPLVVKLGTITENIETADCYSYAKDEDGPVKIPNLAQLLEKRGIKVCGITGISHFQLIRAVKNTTLLKCCITFTRQKTVKSTSELEVELNATYAFDAITEANAKLVPVSGPGLQGLHNLGNSCYMNSVVQMLFGGTVTELSSRYSTNSCNKLASHPLLNIVPKDAPSDLLCQTTKLCNILTNGFLSNLKPENLGATDSKSTEVDPKYQIQPRMFKHAVGSDHVDFRTGQQQDAAQYLQYLLEKLDRAELKANTRLNTIGCESSSTLTASNLFKYKTSSRLICENDGHIKHVSNAADIMLTLRIPLSQVTSERTSNDELEPDEKRLKPDEEIPTVTFKACLDAWVAPQVVDGMRWSHLSNTIVRATKESKFLNFPRYLLIQMQRYDLGPDWMPRKISCCLDMPEEIDLNYLRCMEQEGIHESHESSMDEEPVSTQPNIDKGKLTQLMDMGFSMNGCKRALTAVGGSNLEAAMNWIFEHNTDTNFNEPPEECSNVTKNNFSCRDIHIDEGVVMSLVENLGCFTADQVRVAMKECEGNTERAADWLFSHMDNLDGAIAALTNKKISNTSVKVTSSISQLEDGDGRYTLVGLVSHIGKNTGSGHYVVHLKKNGKWILFNDDKVFYSKTPPFEHAYLYLFKRTDTFGSPNERY